MAGDDVSVGGGPGSGPRHARLAALLACLPPPADRVLARGYTAPAARGAPGIAGLAGVGAAVTVRATDPAVLGAVDRVVGHAYTPGPPRPAGTGWQVDVISVEPHVLAGLPSAFAGATSLDLHSDLPARYLPTPDGGGLVFATDPDPATAPGAGGGGERTVIVTDPARGVLRMWSCDRSAGRRWAPQLARHAVTAQLRAGGAVHARAGAVTVGGVGVLLMGPPGCGSTTSLLAALRVLDADLVTPDRLLLARDDLLGRSGVVGWPWPAPTAVGVGSLLPWPSLRHLLAAPDPGSAGLGDRVLIDPSQAELLLTRGQLATVVRPRLVLWPQLAFGGGPPSAPGPPLRTDIVRHRLTHYRLGMRHHDPSRCPDHVLDHPHEPHDPQNLHSPDGPDGGGCGPRARDGAAGDGSDWLSHPSAADPAHPADPGLTPVAGAVIDGLTRLDHRRLWVSERPAWIAAQISRHLSRHLHRHTTP